MMFVVNPQPYSNKVEVKLAHESKKKIAKIAYWTVVGGSFASICWDRRDAIVNTLQTIKK